MCKSKQTSALSSTRQPGLKGLAAIKVMQRLEAPSGRRPQVTARPKARSGRADKTSLLKGFPKQETESRTDHGRDFHASACVQRTPADVDPHPRTTALRALGSQAKRLQSAELARCGAPVAGMRPGRCHARANAAARSAGLLTAADPIAVQGDTLRFVFVSRASNRRPPAFAGKAAVGDARPAYSKRRPRQGVHK